MDKVYNAIQDLKKKKLEGANYNYKEDKRNLLFELQQKYAYPCGENVLINTRHLERTFKYLKKFLKN